jgi:hypothetical protein
MLAAGPHWLRIRRVALSQEFTELFHGQASVSRNIAHVEMIDARDLGQGSNSYFDFANFLAAQLFVDNR